MFLCIASEHPLTGIITGIICMVVVVGISGLKFHDYIGMLLLPLSFMLLSGLALLIQFGCDPSGIMCLPFLNGYLYVSETSQSLTALVIAKAFGAMSCLYLLSLTTPMTEIINVLKRLKFPSVVIQLMYLIYRCIFILLGMHHQMKTAARSRLGYVNYQTSIRTTGNIYANLLIRSYKKANQMFDAMESRCFDGEIAFLEGTKIRSIREMLMAIGMITLVAAVMIF
jgi:cobalt/nickel transport system permease protein